jgi:hypothetical protein
MGELTKTPSQALEDLIGGNDTVEEAAEDRAIVEACIAKSAKYDSITTPKDVFRKASKTTRSVALIAATSWNAASLSRIIALFAGSRSRVGNTFCSPPNPNRKPTPRCSKTAFPKYRLLRNKTILSRLRQRRFSFFVFGL